MPFIQLKGKIVLFDIVGEGSAKRLIGKFSDGTGVIDLVWFKGISYTKDRYKLNTEYIVFGKPTAFGSTYNIVHPDIDSLDQADQVAKGLTPYYNTTERMKKAFLPSRAIQNLQYMFKGITWDMYPVIRDNHIILCDTGSYMEGGRLSCIDVITKYVWQA